MKHFLKTILSNGIIPFVGVKYFSLGLQFLATLLIANKLGPFYFGIWSFIILAKQYLTYSNFGVNYSLNAILSTNFERDEDYKKSLFHNALVATLIFFIVVCVVWAAYYFSPLDMFEKYNFKQYSFYLLIFILFENINQIFINLYRIYSKIKLIAIFQLLIALSRLIPVLYLSGEELIYGLLYYQIGFSVLSYILFTWYSPLSVKLKFDYSRFSNLTKRGINLLFYNLSFYFLIISTKTLISYFYSVEIYGEYGFAAQLASIAQVGMSTITFLFFPKFLNRLKEDRNKEVIVQNLDLIKNVYSTLYVFITLVTVCLIPLVDLLFPDYALIKELLIILLLINVALSFAVGHNSLMISWGKEFTLTITGIISIGVNVSLLMLLNHYTDNVYIVLFGTVVSALFYSFLLMFLAERELKATRGLFSVSKVSMYLIVLALLIYISIYDVKFYVYTFPLLVYIVLDFKNLKSVSLKVYKLIKNKGAIEL